MISIIICTRNRAKSLVKTLDSLKRMRRPDGVDWELVVIDNGSIDETKNVVLDFIKSSPFPIRYAFEPRPGLSCARNTGVSLLLGATESSESDLVVAFTDDDVIVDQNWLGELVRSAERFDCVGFAGKIIAVWNCPKPSWFEDSESYGGAIVQFDPGNVEKPVDYAVGANMAFRRAAFERHGLFRTDLGAGSDLPGGEEVEFCNRLVAAGERLMYVPKVVTYHPVETNRVNKSYIRKHAWANGRYEARIAGFPPDSILYFRIPRFIFRKLGESLLAWAFSGTRERRFHHELRVMRFAGSIAEACRVPRRSS